jgi:uncharacterized membrane protein
MKLFKTTLALLFLILTSSQLYSQTLSVETFNENANRSFKIPISIKSISFNEFSFNLNIINNHIDINEIELANSLKDGQLNTVKTEEGLYISFKSDKDISITQITNIIYLKVRSDKSFLDTKIIAFENISFLKGKEQIEVDFIVRNATAYKKSLIKNDTMIFGLLMIALGFVFFTDSKETGFWNKFYKIVPGLFMAYMIPALFTTLGLIAPEWDTIDSLKNIEEHSTSLYYVSSRYLLPAALVLMTLSIDLKAVFNLGWKALVMFITGTIGIVIGGPIAILLISIFSPETVGGVGPDAVWRGLSTLAGSWIGGGANQTAMFEIFKYTPSKYGAMVFVDIVVANVWMALLLIGIGKRKRINKWLGADTTAIEELKEKVSTFAAKIKRNPSLTDLMIIAAIAFGTVSLAHLCANFLAPLFSDFVANIESPTTRNIFTFLGSKFFWMISIATIIAVLLSFTKAKNYEGAGASKFGSVFIYILVATIGMKMDLTLIFDNVGLIAVGVVWMSIHAGLLILIAKLIKAPYFFLAIGSQANVGGAASAPIVASAFHPSLATVGVLLAVVGYAIGTVAAILCTILMELAAVS